jgi:hypothetical protein
MRSVRLPCAQASDGPDREDRTAGMDLGIIAGRRNKSVKMIEMSLNIAMLPLRASA